MGLDFEAESRWPREKEKEEEVPNRGNKIDRGNRVSRDRGGKGKTHPLGFQTPASSDFPLPLSSQTHLRPPLCFLCSRLFLHSLPSAWRAMAKRDHGQVAAVKLGSHFCPSPSLRIGDVTPIW